MESKAENNNDTLNINIADETKSAEMDDELTEVHIAQTLIIEQDSLDAGNVADSHTTTPHDTLHNIIDIRGKGDVDDIFLIGILGTGCKCYATNIIGEETLAWKIDVWGKEKHKFPTPEMGENAKHDQIYKTFFYGKSFFFKRRYDSSE